MTDWYPRELASRVAWHANFALQASTNGTTLGLVAGQVTQAGIDSTVVAAIINHLQEVSTFSQAVTAWKDHMFNATIGTPTDAPPTPPSELSPPLGALPAIIARTRQYAAIIKADPDYTPEIGELYGILPPASAEPGTPGLVATALTQSQVEIKIDKAGYTILAIDSRRGAGTWEQIGVSQLATYVDNRAPLVVGQPEQREYRAQGMENNQRVGALSSIVSAVTVP